RSVYLLPLYPALAVLLALGVQQPPTGRLAGVLRVTTVSYAPALVILGLAAGALASGVDVVAGLRPRLKPRDAQNTLAAGAAARAARARRRRARRRRVARARAPARRLAARDAGARRRDLRLAGGLRRLPARHPRPRREPRPVHDACRPARAARRLAARRLPAR